MMTLILSFFLAPVLWLGLAYWKRRPETDREEIIELEFEPEKMPPAGSVIPLEDPSKMPRQHRFGEPETP